MGVLLRLSPIFRAPATFKEFDVWTQYNNVLYLVNNGLDEYYHWHSTQFWYPDGKDMWWIRPGTTFTAAFAYFFLNFLGIQVTVYDVCYYYPAVVAGFEIIAMYYLGKEVLDSRTGLLAAFFLAFNPGHLQRSTAGFFDNEALGVFAAILFFLFYIKAMKSGKFKHAVAAGLSSALLCLSWGASQYPLLLVPVICLVFMLSGRYNDNAFMVTEVTSGISLIGTALQPNMAGGIPEFLTSVEFLVPLVFMLFAYIVYWFNSQKSVRPKFHETIIKIIKWGAIPAIIVAAVVIWGFPDLLPFDITGRIASVLNPFIRDTMAVVSSVGEHQASAWSVFYFNTLIPIFLIPVGIFFALKRLQHADIAMIVFVLTIYYFTGSMVRIIMLFAPVAALVGAYGLSSVLNYFGNIGRKKTILSRRRKRQAKNTMGPEDTFWVFVVVGVLMVAQVVQTADVAVTQMSYSELIVGGQYQDWPEALTWMRTNLAATTVVVSWWDYGYWCTVIGNVTTVNDNGTDNATRMGLTGMAMMQVDELESAKIFRMLHADYVLVYWGFLVNGLGGDEGKWPWMVRICNEYMDSYKDLRVSSGPGAWKENSVFDYEEYYNSSSGSYEDKWFQSQLVKMMFYGEPTSQDQARDSLGAYFALQVAGGTTSDGSTQEARKTDNGATWASMIPSNGYYSSKAFTPAFFSSNRLVKVFKVDYTALDSDAELSTPIVYSNGIGSMNITNMGIKPITLGNLTLETEETVDTISNIPVSKTQGSSTFTYTSSGSLEIQPGENITVWFDAGQPLTEGRQVSVTATLYGTGQDGQQFDFARSSPNAVVKIMPDPQIEIDRSQSVWWLPTSYIGNVNVTVVNTGSIPVLVDDALVNGGSSTFAPMSNSLLVLPQQSSTFAITAGAEYNQFIPLEVGIKTLEGASDTVILTNNSAVYKISILPEDYVPLAEGIAKSTPPTVRKYIPVTPTQTVAWGNDTIEFAVKNTGKFRLGLKRVYLFNGEFDDIPISGAPSVEFETREKDNFLDPGVNRTIITSLSGLTPNSDLSIFVTAIGLDCEQVAADCGILKVIDTQAHIQLLGDASGLDASAYGTIANANETVKYVIKNIGNQPVNVTSVSLNNTVFTMNDGTFYRFYENGTRYNSSSFTLGIQEVGEFVIDAGIKNVRLNDSTTCLLGATTEQLAFSNITARAEVKPGYPLVKCKVVEDSENTYYSVANLGALYVMFENTGIYNVMIETLFVNGTPIDIMLTDVIEPGDPKNMTIRPEESKKIMIQIGALFPTTLDEGDTLVLAVLVKEGFKSDALTISVIA